MHDRCLCGVYRVRHLSVVVRCVTVVLPVGCCLYIGVCVVLCMIDRLGPAVGAVTKVFISADSIALIVLSAPSVGGRRVGRKLLQRMDIPRLCSSVRLVEVPHPPAKRRDRQTEADRQTETDRGGQTDRDRQTEADRQRQTGRDRQSHRDRYRHRDRQTENSQSLLYYKRK